MKYKLRMIWRILCDRQVIVITESYGKMYYAWWEVNRVPEFYKNQSKTKE